MARGCRYSSPCRLGKAAGEAGRGGKAFPRVPPLLSRSEQRVLPAPPEIAYLISPRLAANRTSSAVECTPSFSMRCVR
jgi:hypothetical protein